MIHINSYKLTPAITATWGDITGNVSNQEDLVEYIKEHGTAAWGSISGNISDQSDLMSTLGSYATESWVSSQQFATESWVSEQGYLTSVPSEYATQSWVSDQGYLTSVPSEYATQSWVSEQGYLTSVPSEYATQSWVSEQGYLTSTALTGYATESWVSEQGYLTEHQPLKTVNNQSLVGEGNIEIGVEYDEEIPIGDPENTDSVDVIKRPVDEETYETEPLVLGYAETSETTFDAVTVKGSQIGETSYSVEEGEVVESDFNKYATESWVEDQRYATESWVTEQITNSIGSAMSITNQILS